MTDRENHTSAGTTEGRNMFNDESIWAVLTEFGIKLPSLEKRVRTSASAGGRYIYLQQLVAGPSGGQPSAAADKTQVRQGSIIN